MMLTGAVYFTRTIIPRYPNYRFKISKTFEKPDIPSLKWITAEATPIPKTSLQTNTSLGHLFQIIWLNSSFEFWVVPCRHHFDKFSEHKSTKISFIAS